MSDQKKESAMIIILPSGDLVFHIPESELTEIQQKRLLAISALVEPSYFLTLVISIEVALTFLQLKLKAIFNKEK